MPADVQLREVAVDSTAFADAAAACRWPGRSVVGANGDRSALGGMIQIPRRPPLVVNSGAC